MCAVCQYAKQKRRQPPKNTITLPSIPTIGGLSDNIIEPGQRVSVNLYVAAAPGRLPNTFGKEKVESQFIGGAIFVDHATRYIFNQHQHSTTTAESVLSKYAFENHSSIHGVKICEYVADNNPFHGKEWTNDCLNQQQQQHFSGVGAHCQNYSERQIQIIFNMSRAMLIHSALHWPQVADTNLWPFAVDHPIYIWNNIPGREASLRMSPKELFTGIKYQNHNHLRLYVFRNNSDDEHQHQRNVVVVVD